MTIELANRLCAYRKYHGLSQEELAEKLEISRQAVSCWERAETSPDTDNLILLSKIYSVTLDELLYRDPQKVSLREPISPQTSGRKRKKYNWCEFPFTLICFAAYICLGVLFSPGSWGWGLMVFLLVPLYYTLFDAIAERDPLTFCFPVLVLLIYLILGITLHWWHPGWLVFLTIPIYYTIWDFFG